MSIDHIFEVASAIIVSLGGGALIVAAFANYLGKIWANQMLQNERAKHAEALESIKTELDLLKQKNITRHHDKLSIYRDVIHVVCEILRELEGVTLGKKDEISEEVEQAFSLNRNKAYGYISLVSNQEVMDRYNELIEYFLPIMYEGQKGVWSEMREKSDALLNSMRRDLGVMEEDVFYRGER